MQKTIEPKGIRSVLQKSSTLDHQLVIQYSVLKFTFWTPACSCYHLYLLFALSPLDPGYVVYN